MEINHLVKGKAGLKIQKGEYERLLFRKDISAEGKKKLLVKCLYELLISTFSASVKQTNKKSLGKAKANIGLIRAVLHNLKAINNYLEESLLRELGIIKKSLVVQAIKSIRPEKYLEKSGRKLPKGYIDKIESIVYELMHKIVIFDKKLMKDYKKKEIRIIGREKLGIKDLEMVLKIESELLDALEAKIPPPSKIKPKLFKKDIFNKWVPMVFALLLSFETEYSKERLIFAKIKNNNKLRNKIESKIRHVVNEKERILRIKEKRALAMKRFKISDDYRQTFHEYVYAASL